MSIISEELESLFKAFTVAAEVDDDAEMQRILAIEDVQLHFYASENAWLRHFVEKGIKQKGYERAVTYLIQFGLVSSDDRGHTPFRNLVCALETAIDHEHFGFVKLLAPMLDAHPSLKTILTKAFTLTFSSLGILKFLLTLSGVKNTLGKDKNGAIFFKLIRESISLNALDSIESLLAVDAADACLSRDLTYWKDKGEFNDFQVAANLNRLAILYCLAEKKRQSDLKCFSTEAVPNFEHFTINIQDQPISIGDFLRNYEQEVLLGISVFDSAIQKLDIRLLPPIRQLIMDYFGALENIPSTFKNKSTTCLFSGHLTASLSLNNTPTVSETSLVSSSKPSVSKRHKVV